jgi:hypothetical protein
MKLLIGLLAGLAWGALCGFLNTRILKRAVEKNDNNFMMAANILRILVDLVALGAVFLLRGVLPFSYEAALVGTAIALSLLTIAFAFRYGKK